MFLSDLFEKRIFLSSAKGWINESEIASFRPLMFIRKSNIEKKLYTIFNDKNGVRNKSNFWSRQKLYKKRYFDNFKFWN